MTVLLFLLTLASPACHNEPPQTSYDFPTCADIAIDERLRAALENGDVAALDEVRRRYEQAFTHYERHFLGSLLLDHLDDDTTVWNDLSSMASVCVRMPRDSEELKRRAGIMRIDPSLLWSRSYDALTRIAHDSRSRPLLQQALASDDQTLRAVANLALAERTP